MTRAKYCVLLTSQRSVQSPPKERVNKRFVAFLSPDSSERGASLQAVTDSVLEPPLRINTALVALGCAFAVAVAWQPLAGWIGVLSAVGLAWGVRRIAAARPFAPWVSVFAAVAVFAAPPYTLESIVTERFAAFFATLFLTYLIGAALDGVEAHSGWAWLAPLIGVAVFPTPLGIAGGLGLALLGRLDSPLPLLKYHPRAAVLAAVALVGLATTLSLALPAPGAWLSTLTAPAPATETSKPDARPSTNMENDVRSRAKNARLPLRGDLAQNDWLYVGVNLLLLVGVAALTVFLLNSRLERGKAGARRSWWESMPVVAVLILMTVLIVWSGMAPAARDGSAQGFSSSTLDKIRVIEGQTRENLRDDPKTIKSQSASSVTPWLLGLSLALIAYLLWRNRPRSFTAQLEPDAKTAHLESTPEHATDEVRRCYTRFLELSRAAGLPRGESETPLEFAARVSEVQLPLAAPVQELTRLYEPVRYGQFAAATHGDAARAALQEIETALQNPVPRAEVLLPSTPSHGSHL